MAQYCFHCGKQLSFRDSFVFHSQPVCRRCLNEIEETADPAPASPPAYLMDCPKCGQPRNPVETLTVDRKTKEPVKVGWFLLGILFTFMGVFLMIAGVMSMMDTGVPPVFAFIIAFFALSGGLPVMWRFIRADRVRLTRYRCTPCGQHWEQVEEGDLRVDLKSA